MDWITLLPFFLLVAATGCFAGFLSGILGVGGGIVIVPVLYYTFEAFSLPMSFSADVSLHTAIGTSLATIIMTQSRSAYGHRGRGSFDDRVWAWWSVPMIIGALIGALVAGALDSQILAFIFATGMFLVALLMFYRARLAEEKIPPARFGLYSRLQFPISGFSGMFAALTGIGGGTFNVAALNLLFGMDIRRAIGTSAGLGALIGAVGAGGFVWTGWDMPGLIPWSLGYVNLLAVLMIVPFTIIFSPIGVRAAHAISPRKLQVLFAMMLVIASAFMFHDALGQ